MSVSCDMDEVEAVYLNNAHWPDIFEVRYYLVNLAMRFKNRSKQ